MDAKPEITRLVKTAGIAGQVAVSVTANYPGEAPSSVVFVGSTFGSPGPVVMVQGDLQTRVSEPDRFGDTFGTEWARRFFS